MRRVRLRGRKNAHKRDLIHSPSSISACSCACSTVGGRRGSPRRPRTPSSWSRRQGAADLALIAVVDGEFAAIGALVADPTANQNSDFVNGLLSSRGLHGCCALTDRRRDYLVNCRSFRRNRILRSDRKAQQIQGSHDSSRATGLLRSGGAGSMFEANPRSEAA
jgi:hypothetical protein